MPINADLVVLSACNTAGDPQRGVQGEGFAGLTRTFLFTGARHLLVSHWLVASDSTRDLMVAYLYPTASRPDPARRPD